MRILLFTTLYPNPEQPRHGIFIEERLRQLRRHHPSLDAVVVAPVPWFPSTRSTFGSYARYARVPVDEVRDGVRVLHPRFPVIPKVGMSIAPLAMSAALAPFLARLKQTSFDFQLIDAHFLYPDGISAVRIANALSVPVVVTARGSDLTLYPTWAVPRLWLRWCLRNATAVAGVSQSLVDAAAALAGPVPELHLLRNGVDLDRFSAADRDGGRRRLAVEGFVLLSVGHLLENKGHHLVIDAVASLPDTTLLIAGDGPMRRELEERAESLGAGARVRFLGLVPHADLPPVYAAADALVLASGTEGMPNVVLEAMACGTPVIATRAGGIPEVVTTPDAGILVDNRTGAALAAAVGTLRERYPGRARTRAHAEQFGWRPTSDAQWDLFRRLIAQRSKGHRTPSEQDG